MTRINLKKIKQEKQMKTQKIKKSHKQYWSSKREREKKKTTKDNPM